MFDCFNNNEFNRNTKCYPFHASCMQLFCLLITFANSLDQDQDTVRQLNDLDPNCLTPCMIMFLKKLILKKKSADDNKSMYQLPSI